MHLDNCENIHVNLGKEASYNYLPDNQIFDEAAENSRETVPTKDHSRF